MCKQSTYDSSSNIGTPRRFSLDKSIGDLFRDYGEEYIKIYKPNLQAIKLIRSIRICKTPALGGKMIRCLNCGENKVIYKSCDNSQCPLCQFNKRQSWNEKLCIKLLKVPYTHTVFTIPHELNGLSKAYRKEMNNILMRASYKCIKDLCAKEENLGALPGMISVLHTFGSDMKYHLHIHALITFGGVDKNGLWKWPKRRKKLASYREISRTFRKTFLKMLVNEIYKGNIVPDANVGDLLDLVQRKRWNVKNGYPTMELSILENYLARYINRIAVSKSRFEYLREQQKVHLIYKEYRSQKKGQAAPLSIKTMEPLVAIDQFLVHILPPYFQKSRYYGLHASSTFKKYLKKIDQRLLKNRDSISTLFSILTALMKLARYSCGKCNSVLFEIKNIQKNNDWVFNFITLPNFRGPPNWKLNINHESV